MVATTFQRVKGRGCNIDEMGIKYHTHTHIYIYYTHAVFVHNHNSGRSS
jgi:hypothetical protein